MSTRSSVAVTSNSPGRRRERRHDLPGGGDRVVTEAGRRGQHQHTHWRPVPAPGDAGVVLDEQPAARTSRHRIARVIRIVPGPDFPQDSPEDT